MGGSTPSGAQETGDDTLDLDGWSRRSVWGWDGQAQSFCAQLWRDEDRGDRPAIWIDGIRGPVRSVEELSAEIAARLGIPAITVRDGMAEAIEAQRLRTAQVRGGWFQAPGGIVVRVLSRAEAELDPDELDLYDLGWLLGFHYSSRTGLCYDTGHVALADVAEWCPITQDEAYEWLQFWGIPWGTVQQRDRVIAS